MGYTIIMVWIIGVNFDRIQSIRVYFCVCMGVCVVYIVETRNN